MSPAAQTPRQTDSYRRKSCLYRLCRRCPATSAGRAGIGWRCGLAGCPVAKNTQPVRLWHRAAMPADHLGAACHAARWPITRRVQGCSPIKLPWQGGGLDAGFAIPAKQARRTRRRSWRWPVSIAGPRRVGVLAESPAPSARRHPVRHNAARRAALHGGRGSRRRPVVANLDPMPGRPLGILQSPQCWQNNSLGCWRRCRCATRLAPRRRRWRVWPAIDSANGAATRVR